MNRDEAAAAMAQYGSQEKAAAALGISRSVIRTALAKGDAPAAPAHRAVATGTPKNKAGRSLADFRQAYDKDTIIPSKVRAALKELGSSWEYEAEFVRRAGVSFADLGNYRELFTSFVVNVRQDNKRVWAGTAALAAQLKEMVA